MILRKASLILLLCAGCCVAAAPVAEARPRRRSPGHRVSKRKLKRQARRLFVQGRRYFRLGRFKEALVKFTRAYEILPLPAFLYNIGQCHRMLKRHGKAIFFYKGYLSGKPDARNRAAVEDFIRRCEQQIELARRKAREAAQERAAAERARQEEARRLRLAELRLKQQQEETRRQRLLAQHPPAGPRPWYKKWWFWTAVGAAVAAALAGGLAAGLYVKTETVPPSGSLGHVDLRF